MIRNVVVPAAFIALGVVLIFWNQYLSTAPVGLRGTEGWLGCRAGLDVGVVPLLWGIFRLFSGRRRGPSGDT